MRFCISRVVAVYFFTAICLSHVSENFNITYENFYKAGIDAYLENRWYDCITYLEKSLEDYFYYTSIVVQCRSYCEKLVTIPRDFGLTENDTEFSTLFEVVVSKAHCLMKCERNYFQDLPQISRDAEKDFEKKVPYDYLQLCYFKTDNLEKAASCAYTFLIHNSGHEVMQANLRYYMALPNLEPAKIKYLENKDYQELFLKGAQIYTEKKFKDTIELMEKALQEYLIAENECRLMCDGPIPISAYAGFYVTVANHFTYTLRCKLNCPEKLSYMYGQKHENLFSSYYHYLQFSYYKSNRLKEACQSVASFLILHPDDHVMTANKKFYSKMDGVNQEWFSPRSEAVEYHRRTRKEQSMLLSIENLFQLENTSQAIVNLPTPPPGSPIFHKPFNTAAGAKLGSQRTKLSPEGISKWLMSSGISTYMKDKDLNGTLRVAFNGLANQNECDILMNLASDGAVHGDGYNGRESPHTEFEMFEGLTVARAATLSQRGILDPVVAQLFLNISEKARKSVETYFNLDTELFFAYTHLVCRTALPDSPGMRNDLSHPVHADNCVLTPDGDCLKQRPAYTWRDYSSIVYLNDNFEGGEFIFAKDKHTVQASIKPKCGLMVAFSAGKENLHGVKAVKKGRRCALAMWYTLDPRHTERERDFARNILSGLVEKRKLLKNKNQVSIGAETFKDYSLRRLTAEKHSNAWEENDAAKELSNSEHKHVEF